MSDTARNRWFLFFSFVAGMTVMYLEPKLAGTFIHHALFRVKRQEIARVGSPDGAVDAVMTLTDCGAPCSSAYTVYVVPKGQKPPDAPGQDVFSAEDVVDGKLAWKEAHLLDISYSRALIDGFRNVTHPFGKIGDEASWRYAVEVRLSPASAGFSYLRDEQLK
jgi:hypothetical protein